MHVNQQTDKIFPKIEDNTLVSADKAFLTKSLVTMHSMIILFLAEILQMTAITTPPDLSIANHQ